jgi:hypothetical protein
VIATLLLGTALAADPDAAWTDALVFVEAPTIAGRSQASVLNTLNTADARLAACFNDPTHPVSRRTTLATVAFSLSAEGKPYLLTVRSLGVVSNDLETCVSVVIGAVPWGAGSPAVVRLSLRPVPESEIGGAVMGAVPDAAARATAVGGAPPPGGRGVRMGGDPIILGALDKALIDEVVLRGFPAFNECYESGLARTAGLSGKITIKFVVAADGTVTSSNLKSTTMNEAEVETCVAGTFSTFRFAEPRGGGIVIATYPLVFSPG